MKDDLLDFFRSRGDIQNVKIKKEDIVANNFNVSHFTEWNMNQSSYKILVKDGVYYRINPDILNLIMSQ